MFLLLAVTCVVNTLFVGVSDNKVEKSGLCHLDVW